MVAAIYYHPDGYETSREHLMGRHAAGEGMLKALCRYTKERIEIIRSNQMMTFGSKLAYPQAQIIQLLESLPDDKSVSVQSLCSRVPASEGRALLFSLLWLSKVGLLDLSAQTPAALEPQAERTHMSLS